MTDTTVVDKYVPLLDDELESKANPYNKRKPWQNRGKEKSMASADTLFYAENEPKPEPTVTKTAEPKQDNHDWEKRWKDLKSYHDAQANEWKTKLAELEEKFSKGTESAPISEVPKTPEEITKFKESNPDLYAQVESLAKLIAQQESTEVKEKLSDIEKREFDLKKKQAKETIKKAHPDFDQMVSSDEFHEWASAQPQDIQNWIYKNPTDASLAIRALDLYKADNNLSQRQQESSTVAKAIQEGADSLVSTKTTETSVTPQKKIWSRSEINRLSMDEYDRLEAEIDLAIREGRYIP